MPEQNAKALATKASHAAQVLLITLPHVDYQTLNTLIDAELAPNLASLVETGTLGALVRPSVGGLAAEWNSIVTGALADTHGIVADRHENGRPVEAADRKVPAIWDLSAADGYPSCVVGGPATHGLAGSADSVSDLFGHAGYVRNPALTRASISHPALEYLLTEAWVEPDEIDPNFVTTIAPDWQQVNQLKDPTVSVVVGGLAHLFSRQAVALEWLAHKKPALMVVDYPVPPLLIERYRDSTLRTIDALLGDLVAACAENCLIVVASYAVDPAHSLPPVLCGSRGVQRASVPSRSQRYPFLILNGPSLLADGLVFGASQRDILPTLCANMQLQTSPYVSGRVLIEAFEEAMYPELLTVRDSLSAHAWQQAKPLAAEAFGYLPEGAAEGAGNLGDSAVNFGVCEVLALIEAGKVLAASQRLESLIAQVPNLVDLRVMLVHCYLELALVAEAEQALQNAEAVWPTNPALIQKRFDLALLMCDHERANTLCDQFLARDHLEPAVLSALGAALVRVRRWAEACDVLGAVIQTERCTPEMLQHYARSLLALRRFAEAERAAARAIELDYFLPFAHHLQGIARMRLGRMEAAEKALERAIALRPNAVHTHAQLLRIKRQRAVPTEDLRVHEIALAAARKQNTMLQDQRMRAFEQQRLQAQARSIGGVGAADGASAVGALADAVSAAGAENTAAVSTRADEADALPAQIDDEMFFSAAYASPLASVQIFTCISGLPCAGAEDLLPVLAKGGAPIADVSNFAVLNADVSNSDGQIADVHASGFRSSPLSTAELEGLIGKVFNLSFERLAMLPSRHSYELVLVRRDIKQIVGAMRLHDIRPEGDLSDFEAARMLVMKQNRFKAFLALRPNFRVLEIDYDELYATPDAGLTKIAKFFERRYTLDVDAMRRALGATQGMSAAPIPGWLARKLDALRAASF